VRGGGPSVTRARNFLTTVGLGDSSKLNLPDPGSDDYYGTDAGEGVPSELVERLSLLYPNPQLPVTYFMNPCTDTQAFVPLVTCGSVYFVLKQGAKYPPPPTHTLMPNPPLSDNFPVCPW